MREGPDSGGRRIVYSIGHSTRREEDFVELLKGHGIGLLVDVRSIPRSRHNPQFNSEVLPELLRGFSIRYRHMPGLGGLRRARKDSRNTGWRNRSFRGFADYMETAEFAMNVEELANLSRSDTVAMMCAESLPWRCHRSLIADALIVRGVEVRDIIDVSAPRIHSLTPWARVDGLSILYVSPDDITVSVPHASDQQELFAGKRSATK